MSSSESAGYKRALSYLVSAILKIDFNPVGLPSGEALKDVFNL